MKIEAINVHGFEAAIRGMRNSRRSWGLSDSNFYTPDCDHFGFEAAEIGPKDLKLMLDLIAAGSEHAKFLRMIIITADLTLPRYVWQEWDTYKVATVRLSESSMDTMGKLPFVLSDFQDGEENKSYLLPVIDQLNQLADKMKKHGKANKTEAFACRRKIKQLIPESFLQKSTVLLSYQTALSILQQRKNHRLSEWRLGVDGSICSWLIKLPYMRAFYGQKEAK